MPNFIALLAEKQDITS